MSHRGVFFMTHLKNWVKTDYAAAQNSCWLTQSQDAFFIPWGNTFAALSLCTGTCGGLYLQGFLPFLSLWLTALSGGGEGVKLGWNRWWENAARYSQLLRLITCCPQRWSSCHSSVITSDCFWKPDTCHQGNWSTWLVG